MAEPAGINIKDMMGIAKRRAWIVALCFALITPLATMIAYVLPPVYRAEAKILVEGQQIPGDLAQSIVTSSAAEQIEILRQRLLTRRTLISIIEKFNLYGQSYTLGEKIEKLREAIEFESINLELNRRDLTVSAVAISTSASSATVSASVANELVTLAVDLSQRQRTEQAVETVSFFRERRRASVTRLRISSAVCCSSSVIILKACPMARWPAPASWPRCRTGAPKASFAA